MLRLGSGKTEAKPMTSAATITKAGKGTGSVAKASRKGRKPIAPDMRSKTVRMQVRDLDLLLGFLSGAIPASALVNSPAPKEPTEPNEDASAQEWREYAQAVKNYPDALAEHAARNVAGTRIANALNAARNDIPLRARRTK